MRASRAGGAASAGSSAAFPPAQVAEVKALACELPSENGVPLSRWSSSEIAREAVTRGIVGEISGMTVWRWLTEDAIRPWNYRSWIFPRDPHFTEKAGPILDLYEGRWQGELFIRAIRGLRGREAVDPGPRPQASDAARGPGGGQRVEHEYARKGALCYLAAWDVRRAKMFDRCDPKDGIVPFDALVEQFMSAEPSATPRACS